MNNNQPWYRDESFWVTAFDFMFPEKRMNAAESEVESMLALAGEVNGPILDLACGPARHALAFAERGYTVTGVDITPFLLSKARERSEAAGAAIELVESDMKDFVRPDTYSLAINMFTSFGYYADHEENMQVLRNVHRSLLPGGTFILDVAGKEILARIHEQTSSFNLTEGIIVHRREVIDSWSRIRNEWIWILDDTVTYRHVLEHWMYSARELIWMMQEAGFTEVTAYGDLRGGAYDQNGARLTVVGRK